MACEYVSESCKLRCPLITELSLRKHEMSEKRDTIIDKALSEDVDEASQAIADSLAKFDSTMTSDKLASTLRQLGGLVVEDIDIEVEALGDTIAEIGLGCKGPIEFMSEDSAGRSIGIAVCGSAAAPEGESFEPAYVYRFENIAK